MVFEREVAQGRRFEFGKNWTAFLKVLDEDRILTAEKSLQGMLEMETLKGKSFLDIGSGSGLFSLAARRLGSTVYSFDYDPRSVACTQELKRRYFADDKNWTIEQGSVLDSEYLEGMEQFDIVYSWGVLHHTGKMWQALGNAATRVKGRGMLFIAVYNDQGFLSKVWTKIKRNYCEGNKLIKLLMFFAYALYSVLRSFVGDIVKRNNPVARYTEYRKSRGMSRLHDWKDWLGGYPFEVAKPEEVFSFYKEKGFLLSKLKTCAGGKGCNEYVFRLCNLSSE